MHVSISDLLPFLACEYAGSNRLDKRLWSGSTDALYLGTALHKYMEWKLLPKEQREATPEPAFTFTDLASTKSFAAMVDAVRDWECPWHVWAVEREVTIPLLSDVMTEDGLPNDPVLKGRLDAVVRDEKGRYWSLQWKTIGKGQNIGAKLEEVRMSPHEIAYARAYRQETGIPLVGTIVGLFRKSLTKQEVLDKVPVFQLYPLLRSQDEVDDAWLMDIRPKLLDLIGSCDENMPRNWTQCAKFGNTWKQCPLFDHCHLGVSIESLGLVPLEDRYGSEEAPED